MWCVRHYLVTPARTSAITLENATDPMPWMAQDTKKYTHNNNEINYNINNDNNRIKEKWDRCFTFYTTILARLYIKTHLYLSLSCLLSFALNAWHCCPFACIIFYSTLCNHWNVWLLLFYAQRIHLILSEHTKRNKTNKFFMHILKIRLIFVFVFVVSMGRVPLLIIDVTLVKAYQRGGWLRINWIMMI